MKKFLVLVFVFSTSSLFAQSAYLGVNGTYNIVDSSGVDSSMGGEVYGGLSISPEVFLEAYLAYNMFDVTGADITSVNFGAKIGTRFAEFFIIKAGAGLQRLTAEVLGFSASSNDFEAVANAGVELPVGGFYLVALANFSRVFNDDAYNTYGASLGFRFGL